MIDSFKTYLFTERVKNRSLFCKYGHFLPIFVYYFVILTLVVFLSFFTNCLVFSKFVKRRELRICALCKYDYSSYKKRSLEIFWLSD